jgi:predicted ATPase
MIEEIEIANFRAFSKPVNVRFRPITILVGKNSAGKSTLMKFLLMLRQSLESSHAGFFVEYFVTEGRHVRLGEFRQLRNRNPGFRGTRLTFRIRLRTPEGPSPRLLQLWETLKKRNVALPEADGSDQATQQGSVEAGAETDFDIRAEVSYKRLGLGRQVVIASQGERQLFRFKSQSLKDVRFLSFPSKTTQAEGELRAIARESFLRPARNLLAEPRHLMPVREDLQPVIERSNPPPDDVGHYGESAYQHLYEILNRGGPRAEFITEGIRSIANIDELEFKARAREFRSHFRGRNCDTGARCHLKDFGFGVGQSIPVFVQGALLQKGQLLMVEQPEAQLHPTAQLELGTFFVDLWQHFGVPSLVETHSDNLILRLRKLVKRGKLTPRDISIAYFAIENRTIIVKNLDILEDGRLGKGLPMEFFGADLIEVLDMQGS